MPTKKYVRLSAIALVVIVALTGCGGVDGDGGEVTPVVVYVDAKPVVCVIYDGGSYASGLDCNWDAFNG